MLKFDEIIISVNFKTVKIFKYFQNQGFFQGNCDNLIGYVEFARRVLRVHLGQGCAKLIRIPYINLFLSRDFILFQRILKR